MSVARIVVRMYRRLLGDCFLIRIVPDAGPPVHILIDCGLLQGLDQASARMQAVAADIAATCGGKLDLLVVTHEHWDHISGFSQAKDVFFDSSKLAIGQLWMAWTECPTDPDAKRLRDRFDDRQQALAAFAQALDESGYKGIDAGLIDHLDRFIGPVDEGDGAGLGLVPTGRLTGRRILEALKTTAANTAYLSPGQVVTTPGAAPLRVAVMGPPRADARLFKDLPSAGADKETYLGEAVLTQSFFGVDGDPDAPVDLALSTPFAPRWSAGLTRDEVAAAAPGPVAHGNVAWLHDRYFAAEDDEQRPQAYRCIDDAWTRSAASLALKLDSDTNNTSLVLAFELPDGSFMVFAADAQVGNWLSWHDQTYSFDAPLAAADILARTRLYKVGHHGSHNATLDRQGLALMTHAELVAMVSTVEAEARDRGKPPGWLMPNPEVAKALYARCQGRVIIGDRDWASDAAAAPHGPQPGFAGRLDETGPLFVEFTVFGSPA